MQSKRAVIRFWTVPKLANKPMNCKPGFGIINSDIEPLITVLVQAASYGMPALAIRSIDLPIYRATCATQRTDLMVGIRNGFPDLSHNLNGAP